MCKWSAVNWLVVSGSGVGGFKKAHLDGSNICNFPLFPVQVAESLRLWTANRLGSARMGSIPIFVVLLVLQLNG